MWYMSHEDVLYDLSKMYWIRIYPDGEGKFYICAFDGDAQQDLTDRMTKQEAEDELLKIAHSLQVMNRNVPPALRFIKGSGRVI